MSAVGKRTPRAQQDRLLTLLRERRLAAGLRQQDIADRLRRPQSFVSKYETGERRLDILELREICVALGITLSTFVRELERSLK